MKKKKSFWQSTIDFIVGGSKDSILDSLQEKVTETIDEAELRLERAIKKILSAIAIFLIVFLGFIFALVGLSKYLSETVGAFNYGVGFIVVGAILIVLALLFRVASNN